MIDSDFLVALMTHKDPAVTNRSPADTMQEVNFGMCNVNGEIDEGMANELRSKPGEVNGRHYGWNFSGLVYFSNGLFHEDVFVYREFVETLSADALEDLMTKVNDKYGYD